MAMPRDFDAIVSSLYHQYMMNMGFNVIRIAPPPRVITNRETHSMDATKKDNISSFDFV